MRARIVLFAVLFLFACPGRATTVRDVARIAGQGVSELQGVGLVIGLPGTGDSSKEAALARPLAQVLANNGLPVPDLDDLKNGRSVALVMVTCETPAEGSLPDDRFDVIVSVIYSASSLAGGQLYLAPLTGPYKGAPVFAIASGAIELDNPDVPTRARVRGGAKIVRAISPPPIDTTFDLILHSHYAGHRSAAHIASRIRDEYLLRPQGLGEMSTIAVAVDDRTVRVSIPANARARLAEFVGDVLSTDVDPGQLDLAAKVIVNRATGAMVVTGDVEISLVAISHKNLVIRKIIPPPEPTPRDPLIETERVVGFGEGRPRDRARLDDLLAAFKQLSVPVDDQIQILQMLHKTGRLHAELVID